MGTSNSERNERAAVLRFFRKAALFLPIVLVLPAVNYFVDPGNVFSHGKEESAIAAEMAAGRNVANFDQFDARLLNRAFVSQVRYRPDVIVLGTSRTLNFHSDLFPGKRLLNSGVFSGTLADLLGLYEHVRQRKLRPSLVVLGIDPWMLNADAYDARTVGLKDMIDSMQARLGVHIYKPPTIVQREKLQTLFSPGYFQEAILDVMTGRKRAKWYVTNQPINAEYTRLPDGSFTYSAAERSSDSAAVLKRAIKYVQPPIFQIAENAPLSRENLLAIDKLVDLVRKDGSEVWLYLPPYHPYVYDHLARRPEYRIIDSGEAAVREMAGRKGIPVLGSFNPHRYGFVNTDFYDGHHVREAGVARIFAQDSARRYMADIK
jgi:hypothetical protein